MRKISFGRFSFWGFIALILAGSGTKEICARISHEAPVSQPPVETSRLPFIGLEVSIGYEHAPITIVMYYSLSCSHCHEFQNNDMPEIQKEFIDTGLVRFIFRDFPTDLPALKAVKIAWCHGKSHYLSIAKKLLETQDKWVPTNLEKLKESENALFDIAKELGITQKDYEKCIADNNEMEENITRANFDLQRNHGIHAVPTFIVNGKLHEGALTAESIHKMLLEMNIHR